MPPLLILYLTFLKRPDAILIPHNWWGQYITTWCSRLQNRRELWNSFGIVWCIQCCQIIQSLCIISVQIRVSVFMFMYYCNNIPGVFLPSTLQMKCCNVAAPAVALSTTTHYGLGKTFHNRGVTSLRAGRGRGWWGYWWNMLASGYTLYNNNIVHTHTPAGHSGGWHI